MLFNGTPGFDTGAELSDPARHSLRPREVVPEPILSALSFQIFYFAFVIGEVKDAPLAYQHALEWRQSNESNHQTSITPSWNHHVNQSRPAAPLSTSKYTRRCQFGFETRGALHPLPELTGLR